MRYTITLLRALLLTPVCALHADEAPARARPLQPGVTVGSPKINHEESPAAKPAILQQVVDLRCEFLRNPIGVEAQKPALSWKIADSRRGARQSAYRLQVASAKELLGDNRPDLWDSGKVASEQSHLVLYQGSPLGSTKRVWWRVKVWDQDGLGSNWSEPTWWEMGLLRQEEFKGEWISAVDQLLPEGEVEQQWVREVTIPEAGRWLPDKYRVPMNRASIQFAKERLKEATPAYQIRREFDVPEPVRRARLYISTLGYHEVRLNGKTVDDHRLEPGFSHYSVRADYVVKDITNQLQKGSNCIGIILGNGRYHEQPGWQWDRYYGKKPVVKAMLVVETISGNRIEIPTDKRWKSDVSFITRESFWVGEVQDARRLQAGWDQAGFDDGRWRDVEIVIERLPESLSAQIYPAEKEMERVRPVAVSNPAPDVWVFDMGRTLVGNAEVKIDAPRGTAVSVRYAHLLHGEFPEWYRKTAGLYSPYYDDMSIANRPGMIVAKQRGDTLGNSAGNILRDSQNPALKVGTPYAMNGDLFVTSGKGTETFQRKFGYRPFRYVEVRGFPGKPSLNAVTGVVLHTEVNDEKSSFACEKELFNDLERAGRRSVFYSLHSHVQDNTGAEKGFHPHMAIWNIAQYAMGDGFAALNAKMLSEIRAYTKKEGLSSLFAGHRRPPGPDEKIPAWMSISEMQHYVELPWVHYLYYGDRRELEKSYNDMRRYVEHLYREVDTKGYLLSDRYGDVWDASASFDLEKCYRFVEGEGYVPVGPTGTPKDFYATAFGYRMAAKAAKIAEYLGYNNDAVRFKKWSEGARAFLQARFFQPDGPSYCKGRSNTIQGSHTLAVHWGVANKEDEAELVRQIAADLQENGHLTTGSRLSYPMLNVLSRYGHVDSAFAIMNRTEYPALGHQLAYYGAIPEGWGYPGLPHKGSPVQTELSQMTAWFYLDLCGVRPDIDQPGFRHFFVAPKIPADLDWAKMAMECDYGRIAVEWRRTASQFALSVTVPPNTQATISVPVVPGATRPMIREGSRPLDATPGVRVLRSSAEETVCKVEAGSYTFTYHIGEQKGTPP